MRSGIRTPFAIFVLLEAIIEVIGDAGIETIVRTKKDIHVIHWGHYSSLRLHRLHEAGNKKLIVR